MRKQRLQLIPWGEECGGEHVRITLLQRLTGLGVCVQHKVPQLVRGRETVPVHVIGSIGTNATETIAQIDDVSPSLVLPSLPPDWGRDSETVVWRLQLRMGH